MTDTMHGPTTRRGDALRWIGAVTVMGAAATHLAAQQPQRGSHAAPNAQVAIARTAALATRDTIADDTTDAGGGSGDPVVAAARAYRATGKARVVVQGNVATFPYGHSQPVLTCAVLRACVVELEPGEVVLSRVAGDTERWEIVPAPAGADGRTTLVVVKPRDCDVTTNLVIATDRRIYDLTLDAPPCRGKGAGSSVATTGSATNPQQPYVRHVRFYYPDETVTASPAPRYAATTAPVVPDPLALDFHYRVRKDRKFPWAPAQVFDDGVRLYVKLPADAARHGEAPALFALAGDGTRTLLNYSVVGGDTYVTDRLVDRAVLVAGGDGTGTGSGRTLVIERDGVGGHR